MPDSRAVLCGSDVLTFLHISAMSTRFEPDRLNGHDGSFTVSPPKRFQSSSVNSDTDDDPGDSDPDYRPVPILKNQSPRRSSRIKGVIFYNVICI
jgi:hypothetical protein